jgi:hypothetical protein
MQTRRARKPFLEANRATPKHFYLYGSSLVRIPPEIGEMSDLESFDPYTSHRLHWFPYEITGCTNLRSSRVSTRALYGNYKYRLPFPPLEADTPTGEETRAHRCSVCAEPFDGPPHRAWISLWVATDVLPLLVNACSEACLQQLPKPAQGYVQEPHRGGPEVKQPDPSFSHQRRCCGLERDRRHDEGGSFGHEDDEELPPPGQRRFPRRGRGARAEVARRSFYRGFYRPERI